LPKFKTLANFLPTLPLVLPQKIYYSQDCLLDYNGNC